MVKRNILKLDTLPIAYTLIGISSHENDYRLCWSLNEHLNLGLVRAENLASGDGKEFSCFAHEDEEREILLISNRCDNGFLLDKYRNFDFILKFDPELTCEEQQEWKCNLKKVPLISAALFIPQNKQMLQKLG